MFHMVQEGANNPKGAFQSNLLLGDTDDRSVYYGVGPKSVFGCQIV